jgi:hypothetical protein
MKQTLWVATNYPGYDAIRPELAKLDQFNDTGPHRNDQPLLSRLPGMVVRSKTTVGENASVNTLISAKVATAEPALFQVPADYKPWKRPEPKP